MLKHFLVVTIRNLQRDFGYTSINVLGLGTGIAVSLLAIGVLLVNLGQASVFAAIASVSSQSSGWRMWLSPGDQR